MKITKKLDHYLLENEKGSYHLSFEDFDKLGESEAVKFTEKQIAKKSKGYLSSTIDFKRANEELGFCEFGIEDFAKKLGLDIREEYELSYIKELLKEDKLYLMFEYVNEILKLFGVDVFKKHEKTISENARYSYLYARDVLKSRFKLGEEAISRYARCSYSYARGVLKSRFELGEEAISKDAYYSYDYAKKVLKSRFELGEEAISESAPHSCWYARDVLKSRFELGEEAISRHAYYSYDYAKEVLKSRFELGEEAISESALYSSRYARYIKQKDQEP